MYKLKIVTCEQKVLYEEKVKNDVTMNNAENVAKFVIEKIGNSDREHLVTIGLNAKGKINYFETNHIGDLNSSIIHPREIFKNAIISNCSSIIIAHNHPSGDLTPSKEDESVTFNIAEAGNILGIELLDHLIVNDNDFYSFKKNKSELF